MSAMKKSAWVVDDDEDHIRTLQNMFTSLGFDSKIFAYPRDVEDNVTNGFNPDLLLVNLNLSENRAVELIAYIRENELLDDPPIIILSDEYNEESEYAIQIGADDQLSFPLTLEELETAVSNAYERRNQEEIIEEDQEEF
ncbi:MAG: response regulator [Anaerolineaceae bacterium]|nr:response regulator [Anaerolineaceae bacterium]